MIFQRLDKKKNKTKKNKLTFFLQMKFKINFLKITKNKQRQYYKIRIKLRVDF